MKIHVLLIVFDFTQIFSEQTNISIQNDANNKISLWREKRQLPDYTRWKSNLETSKPEFIVKVDDDVFNPTRSTPIVGINIQASTKAMGTIIIGGTVDPPVSTLEIDTTPVEYTRFVPPATVWTTVDNVIRPQIKDVQGRIPPFSLEKHADRDESPPAGPHFITKTALSQQFAPITPVAFYPRAAVTPPTVTQRIHQSTPSRSLPMSDIYHTRTTLEDKNNILPQQLSQDAQDLKAFLLAKYTTLFKTEATRTQSPFFVKTLPTLGGESENIITTHLDTYPMMVYNEDNSDDTKTDKHLNPEDAEDESSEVYIDVPGSIKNTVIKAAGTLSSAEDDTKKDKDLNAVDAEDEINNEIDLPGSAKTKVIKTAETISVSNITSVTDKVYTIQRTPKMTKVNVQKQPACSLLKLNSLRFIAPQTLPEIALQLKKWTEKSPIATLIDITRNNLTTMENPIYMMIVDDPSSGQVASAKDVVMVVAGIQGRDHYAVSSAMYVLYQLIDHTEAHSDLLKKFRFWVIPVFNPDGYDYSMTFGQRREWTKNLQQSWTDCSRGQKWCKDCKSYGLRCIVQSCYGVHLDRNFEYQWIPAAELREEHPCGDLYAGSRQLSERETRALTNFLHEQTLPIAVFVAFKEGDVLGVMYPYSHTRKKRAFDLTYRNRASRAAAAAFSISGRPYVAGQTSEFLPLYAGGIEDWIDGHLGIDNTYTIMMFRPTDSYSAKLITEHVVHEAYAALDTLLLDSTHEPLSNVDALMPRTSGANKMFPALIILSVAIIFNS